MKKKGFLSVLLATVMLGSMMAAVPAAAADDDQTLTVWCWDPNFNIYAMQQAEKIYQEDHPDFKLDIQENVYSDIETKLITAATSGDYSTLPDIFLMQDYSYHKDVTSFPDVFTDLTDSGMIFHSSLQVNLQILQWMEKTMVYRLTMAQLLWQSAPIS